MQSSAATISRIILLTGEVEAPVLGELLRSHNRELEVRPVTVAADLAKACAGPTPGTRLLSFCWPVIVPGALLKAMPGPSYNFHPGPPERPGRYPSVFALYDGAQTFGVTAHEMLTRVDSGAIVGVDSFAVAEGADLEALEHLTLMHLLVLFSRLAPHLATDAAPLPQLPIAWTGRKTTKADCDALCVIAPAMDPTEADRRRRACGAHMLKR